jgi:hypothetical protein
VRASTSCGTDRTGPASGRVRPDADVDCRRDAETADGGMTERCAERSRLPPQGGEGGADHEEGGSDANGGDGAVGLWGISRPASSSKRRLTTQAGDFSLEREIAPPRVQAGAESGKTHVDLCPRGTASKNPCVLTCELAVEDFGSAR